MLRRKPVQGALIKQASFPAPMGGLNSMSSLAAMPKSDAITLWNLLGQEMGLRSRLGYYEFALGMTGDFAVRTIMPFNASNPGNSKLFAVTRQGIFDVTSGGSEIGSPVREFPAEDSGAGVGVFHTVVNAAGHFLFYTDEVWGLYIYAESDDTWRAAGVGASEAWTTPRTAVLGERRTNDGGKHYVCTQGGAVGATGPTGIGTGITDGSAEWDYIWYPLVGVDPTTLVFVTVWKHRVFLIQSDTASAFYLGLDSVQGEATEISFAGKFKAGGHLVGLWSWTYDGGSGADDMLVGLSAGGDVVIYSGTDPSIPGAFTLKGVWSVGALPAGRRVATDLGGDLLLATGVGLLPLSKLVTGMVSEDRQQYVTYKISSLFSKLVSSYGALDGWSVALHPQDNALMIVYPLDSSGTTNQLVMSMATKGWSIYTGLPVLHGATFQGKFYFGTPDGRVCVNDGYADNVTLTDPSDNRRSVSFGGITAYDRLGSLKQKMVQMIRGNVTSDGVPPSYNVQARFRYDTSEATGAGTVSALSGAVWDTARWDVDKWPDVQDFASEQRVMGGVGVGPEVALAFIGTALSRTVLIGFDVFYTEGGVL